MQVCTELFVNSILYIGSPSWNLAPIISSIRKKYCERLITVSDLQKCAVSYITVRRADPRFHAVETYLHQRKANTQCIIVALVTQITVQSHNAPLNKPPKKTTFR